jgi:hypothetical protein
MKTLSNSEHLIYADTDYVHAVNYQHLHNAPVTLNYGLKHARTKYSLGVGSSDSITLLQDGVFIYVISENLHLNYVALEVVNTETKEIESDVYLQGPDIDPDADTISADLLDMGADEQLKVLLQYI